MKRNVEDFYPLSPTQQGMLLHTLDAPGSGVYVVQLTCTLEGDLDATAFERAWQRVVERHPILRTAFLWQGGKEPVQVVHRRLRVAVERHDWRRLAGGEQDRRLEAFLAAGRTRGFDLSKAPLTRLALIEVGAERHTFVWSFHHILLDGWSMPLVLDEVFAFYNAFRRGEELEMPQRRPYRDFIVWLRKGDLTAAEAYWRGVLSGFSEPTRLGIDREEPGPPEGGTSELRLSVESTALLESFARRHQSTLNSVLQGTWALLLSRYSGRQDVVFGVTASGRPAELPGAEEMIGLFINTLPVRVQAPPRAALAAWLRRRQAAQAEQRRFEHTPLAQVQAWSEVARGRSLFDSLLVFENYPVAFSARRRDPGSGNARGPRLLGQARTEDRTHYPLTLVAIPGRQLSLRADHDRRRFAPTSARRLLGHLRRLLEAMVGRPEARLGELRHLSAAESHQLTLGWNDREDGLESGLIHQRFEAQAETEPHRVALTFADEAVTYGELDRRADRLASHLCCLGVGPEVRVGLSIERCVEMVVALVGILKAGGAYVPLDPAYPEERLSFMLEDSGVEVLLGRGKDLERLAVNAVRLVRMDRDPAATAGRRQSSRASGVAPGARNLAYVIYTSGSTGRPKGVQVTHGNVRRLFAATEATLGFGQDDVWTLFHSYAFDFSVWEIWGALLYGGRLVVVPYWVSRSPEAFHELLVDERVTILNQTPSAFRQLAEVDGTAERSPSLRRVIFGGEALEPESLEPWLERRGDGAGPAGAASRRPARLVNMYGITETTVHVTEHTLAPAPRRGVRGSVVGRPLADLRVYVLGRHLDLVPVGVAGEMLVGGAGVSRGYHARPGLSAERFVPDPFGDRAGRRLYRSGDLGCLLPGGELAHLGRIDHQVKVRGFRIELGEIETALSRHPSVGEAVVLERRGVAAGDRQLAAYLVPAAGAVPAINELRRFLRQRLPEHMVPAAILTLEAMPLTTHGKVDRAALGKLYTEAGRPAPEAPFIAARTPAEEVLAEIWAQVLRREKVGRHDNFFELGGDSILSLQIVSRANQAGLRLVPRQLFEHQTLAELATVAGSAAAVASEQGPVSGPVPLTPIQHWFFEHDRTDPHHFNQAVLLVAEPAPKPALLARAVGHLVLHHDALRLRFVAAKDGWRQTLAAPEDGGERFFRIDLSALAEERQEAALATAAGQVQAGLDLALGRLFRAVLFAGAPARRDRLLLVAHHLVVDAYSWRVLVEDLGTVYRQLERGEAVLLPAKTTSFKFWAERLRRHARAGVLPVTPRSPAAPLSPLPQDGQGGENREGSSRTVFARFSADETRSLLRAAPAAYRTRINDVLLAALAQGFAAWSAERTGAGGGRGHLLVDLEGHGREAIFDDVDLSRTVGWFTTISPVRLDLAQGDPAGALKTVKEQLRSIPERGIGHGLLRYLGDRSTRRALSRLPQAEVSFNYLGQLDPDAPRDSGPRDSAAALGLTLVSEPIGPACSPRRRRRYLLEVHGSVTGERLRLAVTYSPDRHRRESVEGLLHHVMAALSRLIAHCLSPEAGGATPSDFPLAGLAQASLDRLLGNARGIDDLYPLSPLQEGILFHTVDAPASGVYHTQLACLLRGDFDPGTFHRAWQLLARRHPILRTFFLWREMERPLQAVSKRVLVPFAMEDWRGCSGTERRRRLEAFLEADRRRGFDLGRAPLMRLALMRWTDDVWQLVWSHHHVLLDGWSIQPLFRELFALHEALARGREPKLEEVRPYRDYIAWLERQDLAEAESYWRRALAGLRATEPLLLARERGAGEAAGSGQQSLRLPAARTVALGSLARRRRLTLNTLVQGAWAVLLAHYSGEAEVVFGVTVSGRPATLPGVESMLGLFINTLPLRVEAPPGTKLAAWLSQLQERQVEMRQYEHSPLARVQGWSGLPRTTPLFESIVVFENYPVDDAVRKSARQGPDGFRVAGARTHEQTHYPLSLVTAAGEEMSLAILYARDRFGAVTVQRMLAHLAVVFADMVENPERRLAALSLLSAAQRQQLLVEWNDTRRQVDELSVAACFERQAGLSPEAVAIVFGEERLSYGELDRRADRLAHDLSSFGLGTEDLVGLCLERSPAILVAMLGVLKTGGAYVPFDPAYPRERLEFMLNDSGARVLLSEEGLLAVLPGGAARTVCLDRNGRALRGESVQDPVASGRFSRPGADHLAYVMYTSGSTGKPKGVRVVHRGVVRLVKETGYASFSSREVFLQLAPVSFDASTLEIWGPLLNGGRLVIFPAGPLSLARLAEVVERHRVSTLWLTAGLFHQFVEDRPAGVKPLRQVLAGGDVLSVPHAQKVLEGWEGVRLINGYGPTENTTFTCCHPMVAAEQVGPTVSIGRPISNTDVYLLDRRGRPATAGVAGQLWIGGMGLMRNYHRRPRLTAEKLVPDAASGRAGSRLYGTGDLARHLTGGQIEFLGRFDHQVKVRGYRVEPVEIETVLARHPAVEAALVVARKDVAGGEGLVAYVVTGNGEAPGELSGFLGRRLPEYMVPSAFVAVDSLPLTVHGKVDRRALPVLEAQSAADEERVAPRTAVEERLAAIWAKVLRLDSVGIHDNFFELGGDSILSLQIVARASRAGLRLSPRQLFEHPTVAELARLATPAGDQPDKSAGQGPVVGPVPLTPVQHWFFDLELPRPHHFNQAVLLEVREATVPPVLEAAVARLIAHHDALRLRFTRRGPSWRQVDESPAAGVEGAFARVVLAGLPARRRRGALEAAADALQASLDLGAGPLLRLALFDLGSGEANRLLVIAHHLVVDAVSWRILLEDLETVCRQLAGKEEVALPAKTTSFKNWAESLAEHGRSEALRAAELRYWLGNPATGRLPLDDPTAANLWGSAREVSTVLSVEQTRALLHEVPPVYRTEINDVLLAALALSLARFTGEGRVCVDLEGHGREELFEGSDLSRTVGWFTTVFPVVLEVEAGSDPGVALKSVKEQLRRIPRRGIGYGLLRYLSGKREVEEQMRALPAPEVSFNYLGQVGKTLARDALFAPAAESSGRACGPRGRRPHLLEVNGRIAGERLRVTWSYSGDLHRRSTVEGLARRYVEELESIIAHCRSPEAGGVTPSDFPLAGLSQQSLDRWPDNARGIEDLYPLSPLQEGMLFHALDTSDSGTYHTQLTCLVRGDFEPETFCRGWRLLVERHPILRTSFHWRDLDRPLQAVRARVSLPLVDDDWRGSSAEQQQERLKAFLKADRRSGFDLSAAPLMRLAVMRLAEDAYRLVWSYHHLLLDGWSLQNLFKEVFALYGALTRGGDLPLGAVRPYRDYIAWLERQDLSAAEQYWRRTLAGFRTPTPLRLPGEKSGEPGLGEQGLRLPATTTAALVALARSRRLTPGTLFQGAWALLLSRYSGESQVVFGATVSGRPAELEGMESMLGLFINTLPVRVAVPAGQPLSSWLSVLQSQQARMRQYEYSPLVQVQGWSEVPRGTPLFDSILVFENYPVEASVRDPARDARNGFQVLDVHSHEKTNYPLTVVVVPGEELSLRIQYERGLLSAAGARRMSAQLTVLLEAMAEDPERGLSALPLLDPAQVHQLTLDWNDSEDYPRQRCVHELFEAQAGATPHRAAVAFEDRTLSYGELDRRAGQLARRLRDRGVGPEVRVGVCVERSPETVVALLGTLKAGGAYVPLEPSYPRERLTYTLEDSGVAVLLTRGERPDPLADSAVPRMRLGGGLPTAAGRGPEDDPPAPPMSADNLAYVIYTSGSTGQPKGVEVTHGNVSRLFAATAAGCGFRRDDTWTLFHSFAFDFSVWEIWGALLHGGRLVVVPHRVSRSPSAFYDLLVDRRVTVLNQTPSAFRQLMDADAAADRSPPLRRIIFGGEALATRSLRPWFERHGGERAPRLINMYGITETTVHVTERTLASAEWDGAQGSPVGRPLADLRVYPVDRHLGAVPLGVAGELLVGGAGVSRGYLARPALSAERFVPDPFSARPGERLYRSGDLGSFRSTGELIHLGRIDHQVKVRGFRIELGEIETVLGRHPSVREAVVLAPEEAGGSGNRRLEAFLVPAAGAVPSVGELRRFLRQRLPEHMVPATFVTLETLPLTANGKVDRAALGQRARRGPEANRLGPDATYAAPRTPAEETLAEIWSQVLRRGRVGRHENFFELGGDSILSLQIVSRANQAGLRLVPGQLFDHPTLAELAAVAGTVEAVESEQGPVVGPVPLTPVQHWFFEQDRADPHHFNQALLLVAQPAPASVPLAGAVRKLVLHHDALRLRFVAAEDGWRQSIAGPDDAGESFSRVDLSALSPGRQPSALSAAAGQVQAGLDLAHVPLFRAVLFVATPGRSDRLLLVAHHLVVDGVSWRILVEDLRTVYRQLAHGEPAELPAKTVSYKAWAERLVERSRSGVLRQELEDWAAKLPRRVAPLVQDGPGGDNTEASGTSVLAMLSEAETRSLLQEVPGVYRTRINDVLLTALAQGFAARKPGDSTRGDGHGDRLLVDLESHGREEVFDGVDASRTVGWFTAIHPVLLDLGRRGDCAEALKAVKEQLRSIPDRGIGYGLLRYLSDGATRSVLSALPRAEVSFNYLGRLDPPGPPEGVDSRAALRLAPTPELSGPPASPRGRRRYLLEFNAGVTGGRFRLSVTYSRHRHRRETVEGLLGAVVAALRGLISHCLSPEAGGVTPSDFPLAKLSQPSLDRLLDGKAHELEDLYRLSPVQEGIFFHSTYAPTSGVYYIQLACILRGDFDPVVFHRAWQMALARHPILRTSFVWENLDRPLQAVHRQALMPLAVEDWRELSAARQRERLEAFLEADRRRGFDLSRAPLTRLALMRRSEDAYQLVWSLHHLLLDGWSTQPLFKEVFTRYDALLRRKDLRLPAARPYRDYIAWLERQDLAAAEAYWRRTLAGLTAPTPLPVSGKGEAEAASVGDLRRRLPAGVTALLDASARRRSLTLSTLVQGAWAWVLARYSGEDEVVFGVTVSGRPAQLPGVESILGVFINTLPVRVRVCGGELLSSWLSRLQEQMVEMRRYEYSPLAEVQGWSEVPRGTPLFESILVFENYPIDAAVQQEPRRGQEGGREGGFQASDVHSREQTNFPLMVAAAPGEELPLQVQYERGRFDDTTGRRISEHLAAALTGMAEDSGLRLADLPLLTAAERQQLLVEWNDTRADASCPGLREAPEGHELPVVARFVAQAGRTPQAVAVVCGRQALTYRELDRQAERLGRALGGYGVAPGSVVALLAERGIDFLTAMLAVWKAGGAYLPLDPNHPPARLARVLERSRARPVVAARAWRGLLREALAPVAAERRPRILVLEDLRPLPTRRRRVFRDPRSAAYVLYTSGSTGVPKGAVIEQRGMVNHLRAKIRDLGLSAADTVAQTASQCFDISVWQFVAALLVGGRVEVMPDEVAHDSALLLDRTRDAGVSVLEIVPSMLRAVLDEIVLRGPAAPDLPALAWVVPTGEALPPELCRRWLRHHPGIPLVNAYGPTECSDDVSHHTIRRPPPDDEVQVPIGRPVVNLRLYVLDTRQRPVPLGVSGELCVGGPGVGRGYLDAPGRTAEVFVPDPCTGRGRRLYRTGDLARHLPGGTLEFLGRSDHQVKIRGFRIELGEIEAVLERHPHVRTAVVLAREDPRGSRRLAAHVVASPVPTSEELTGLLRRELPAHMVPALFFFPDSLPLTPNGKVDRAELGRRQEDRSELDEGDLVPFVAPRTPAEEVLGEIWSRVLGLDRVGRHENFFELGGDSILSLQVVSRARQAGLYLSPRQVFEHPSLARLAAVAESAEAAESEPRPVSGPASDFPLAGLDREDLERFPGTAEVGEVEDVYPLSPLQEGILFHTTLAPTSGVYHTQLDCTLRGDIDPETFHRAWQRVVDRHPILRTSFCWQGLERPLQVVHRRALTPLTVEDWRGLGAAGQRARSAAFRAADRRRGFDLSAPPLMRLALMRLSDQAYRLVWSHHHLLLDGWSIETLFKEVFAFYGALGRGREPRLETLRPYRDYIAWLERQDLGAAEAYWRRVLAGFRAPTPLRFDRPSGARETRGAEQVFHLGAATTAALVSLARRRRLTLHTLVQGAWAVLLERYSGEDQVVFGILISGRPAELVGMESMLGLFINTLAVRVAVPAGRRLGPWLAELQVEQAEARQYEYSPLARVQGWSELPPGTPLFHSVLVFENFPASASVQEGSRGESSGFRVSRARNYEQSHYPLTVMAAPGEQMTFQVLYDRALFDPATVRRLSAHLATVLEGMLENPESSLAALPLLPAAERQQLLVEWNDTAGSGLRRTPRDRETSMAARFESQAGYTPEAIAVVCTEDRWSYRELRRRVRGLGAALHAGGVGPGSVVALLAERGFEFLSVMLAVFEAGGAYLPLDPNHPPERLLRVSEQSRARTVVAARAFLPLLREALAPVAPRRRPRILVLEDLPAPPAAPGRPRSRHDPRLAAYVLYTSGSTGVPKGAVIEQRGMLNHLDVKIRDLGLNAAAGPPVVAQTASQCFDISVWQFLAALLVGGRVEVIPDEVAHDPVLLLDRVVDAGVSILETVPSMLRAMLEELDRRGPAAPGLSSLSWLVPTGEALPPELCRRWLARHPGVPLLNAYGPTECSDDVSHHEIRQAPPAEAAQVPIGRAVSNLCLHVLDRRLDPVPIGVAGELCAGGIGVGRGYLYEPKRTAEAFVPDPFAGLGDAVGPRGERLYRTGDRALYLPGGELGFLGRLDHQVKIRGFRIEPGEVEALLDRHARVRSAVVVARETGPATGDLRLVAYVVPEREGSDLVPALRDHLKAKLPHYMIPSAFVVLAELPLTPNGKVDRRALPAPDAGLPEPGAARSPAGTPVQEMLQGIWCQVLGRDGVSPDDHFFEVGGNSLLAIQVVSRCRTAFGVELPLRALFETPTVRRLAARIEAGARESEVPPVVAVPRRGPLPLSFAQQRLWIVDRMNPGSWAYNLPMALRLQGSIDVAVLERALREIVRRHEVLRTTFELVDEEPVQVIGGAPAFELPLVDLARLAEERREREVARLAVGEAHLPVDLERGPVWRTSLVRLGPEQLVALVTMHHIVTDGWSSGVLVREIAALYEAFSQARPSPLPEPAVQYADFAHWQRQWLRGEILERQLAYWKRRLRAPRPTFALPTDHPPPEVPSFSGALRTFQLPPEVSEALADLSREEGATLFMTLLAILKTVLYRTTGQSDLVVGTDVAGRTSQETESLIGFFVNMLALRTDLSGGPGFRELLGRVREVALGAYAHQDLPFDKLVSELRLDRGLEPSPLFDVVLVFQNMPTEKLSMPGTTLRPLGAAREAARFNMTLTLAETARGLSGYWNYRRDLFEPETVARLSDRFQAVAASVAEDPDRSVDDLELLGESERRQRDLAREKRRQRSFEKFKKARPKVARTSFDEPLGAVLAGQQGLQDE